MYDEVIKAGKVERVSPNGSDFAAHVRRAERILIEARNPADPPTSTPAWYARRIIYQAVQLQAERDRGDMDAVIETAVYFGMLLRELAITVKHGGAVAFHAEQAGGAFDREHLSHERGEGQDLKIASQGEPGLEATPDVFS